MRTRPRALPFLGVTAILVVTLSCDENPVDSSPASRASAVSGGEERAPLEVQRTQEEQALFGFARDVAIALGRDSDLRQRVRTEVANSPFREGKVEFKRAMRSRTLGLADAVATERSADADAVGLIADQLPSIAMYFPVDSHRDWAGGEELLVAALLDDDREIVAYNLDGSSYPVSMDEAPDRPTLVLAPAELDFRGPEARSPLTMDIRAPTGYSRTANSLGTDILWMTKSYQPDDHEPWGLGDPELYIHVTTRDTGSTGEFDWTRCSGDAMHASYSDYEFDQNSTTWTGSVEVATKADVDEKETIFQVWEDDNDRCDGIDHLKPKADTVDWSIGVSEAAGILLVGASIYGCTAGSGPGTLEACVGLLAEFVGILQLTPALINDDLVGYAKGKTCFSNLSGPERYYQRDDDGNSTSAYIEIDDDFADRELCPPVVTIGGDEYACTGGAEPSGELTASTTPSAGTLSYKWYEDNVFRGTGTTYDLLNLNEGTRTIRLEVTRSYDGLTDTHTKDIPVYDDPPEPLDCFL